MTKPNPLTRRLLKVTGLVQGVGFRWFVKQLADTLSLVGWVNNRVDGTVELEVEGTAETLNEFERRLKTGNPSARVDRIVAVPVAPRGGNGFEIRRG